MAQAKCATCRFYHPNGDGTGYCSYQDDNVRHNGSCSDYQED